MSKYSIYPDEIEKPLKEYGIPIKTLGRLARERAKIDWDLVIGITGEEGVGKSTFQVLLGQAVDPKFDLERNCIYSKEEGEIKEKILNLPKYSYIGVDEAIKILYSLNWHSPIQKLLNQIYALCRRENKISAFCMPRFKDFNEFFRNHRIKWWIHVVDRGHAVIFTRDWSPVAKDPWWCDDLQKIIDISLRRKHISDIDVEQKLRLLRKARNYLTEIKFDDLDEETKKRYTELVKTKYDDLETKYEGSTISEREQQLRSRLSKALIMLKEKHNYNYQALSRALNVPWESVRNYIKVGKKVGK